jgi:hypothetical protein
MPQVDAPARNGEDYVVYDPAAFVRVMDAVDEPAALLKVTDVVDQISRDVGLDGRELTGVNASPAVARATRRRNIMRVVSGYAHV